jgi:uncharacterized membrane protein
MEAGWFWIAIAFSLIVAMLVFMVPEHAYPFVYARYVLGSVFVFFIPGYSLTRVLFTTKELDTIERISLSVGISITMVVFTGFFLNYTALGIGTIPLSISLLVETISLATLALIRECKIILSGSKQ